VTRILRTPDERFRDLPGYDFDPHYVEVGEGLRMHYVDEGPSSADEVVLLLHGEPSWSYLYRKMIPVLAAAGIRVVAPDLIGFGRSDKLDDRSAYSYQGFVDWMHEFLAALDLRRATLFGQDWGGLIGLRVLAEQPDRFRRAVASNTSLPTGDRPPTEAFLSWQRFSQEVPELPVGRIVAGGCVSQIPDDVVAAYDAPFPEEAMKEAARQFPLLVPTSTDDPAVPANRAAWDALGRWDKPFLCAFADSDPITKGADRALKAHIPGAADQPHTTIEGAGHFVQEDKGEELASVIRDWMAST
jgi:haloalkane dehalogenase